MTRSSALPRALTGLVLLAAAALAGAPAARAQGADPNACDDPSESPNVVVGSLYQTKRWGKVGDVTGFSVGTYSCNVGTCWLNWITVADSNQHPTIGQNMFRLMNGRLEQLGQSWLKHGFYALSDELCHANCLATNGEHLGVNCADPYSADLNGTQNRLGPKFEVNPTTGFHPHPVTDRNLTGDAIFKHLQVHDADLDPALNPGAKYYVEGQYVAEDDATAGNQHDNASYRPVDLIVNGPGDFDIQVTDVTRVGRPGILAWQENDPQVRVRTVDDPDGGRYYVAAKATNLGGGRWHYEYAVQNLDSYRAAWWYSVPVPSSVNLSNIGFHDVAYHSGEPFDGTDWAGNGGSNGEMLWSTSDYATNPNANALRWGTLYNYRFDADRPPTTALVSLGLFRPGLPGQTDRLVVEMLAPQACNGNGTCDAGETCFSCPSECHDAGPDYDGDGAGYCVDCDDNDPTKWGAPSEVTDLHARRGPAGELIFSYAEPTDPGATLLKYEALRTPDASDFVAPATCLRGTDPTALTLSDVGAPAAGPLLYYLVRGRSTCLTDLGTTGTDSFGTARATSDCP